MENIFSILPFFFIVKLSQTRECFLLTINSFIKQTHTKEREKIYRMINCWVHSFIVLNLRKSFGHGFQLTQLVKSLMIV